MNYCSNGINSSWGELFDIYEGAEYNLPDQAAMNTAQIIHQMVSNEMCPTDILLVLISGMMIISRQKKKRGLILYFE